MVKHHLKIAKIVGSIFGGIIIGLIILIFFSQFYTRLPDLSTKVSSIDINCTYEGSYYKLNIISGDSARDKSMYTNTYVDIGNPNVCTTRNRLDKMLNNWASNATYLDKDNSGGLSVNDLFIVKEEVWKEYPVLSIIIDHSSIIIRMHFNYSTTRTTIRINCIDEREEWRIRISSIVYGDDINEISSYTNTYAVIETSYESVVRSRLDEILNNSNSIIQYLDYDNSGGLTSNDVFIIRKASDWLEDKSLNYQIFRIEIDHCHTIINNVYT